MRSHSVAAALVSGVLLAFAPAIRVETAAAQAAFPRASHFVQPAVAFSADGHFLALGDSTGPPIDLCPEPACVGRLHVWDLRRGVRLPVFAAKFARVMSVVFSKDGRYLFSGQVDGTIRAWHLDTGRLVAQLSCCSGSWIRALDISVDDRRLAIGAQNGQVVIWHFAEEVREGRARITKMLAGHHYGVSSVAFEPSGRHLLSSADDQHVRRWNVESGESYEFSRAPGLWKAHRGMVKTVVPLADGRRALSASYWEGGTYKDYKSVAPPDHVLRLWDIDSGRPIRSFPLTFGIRCCIQKITGTSNVAFLKTNSWDEISVLQVFDVDAGAVVKEYAPAMGESFHALAMHPDTRTFLISIGEGHYLLWDRDSGDVLGRIVSVDEGWAVAGDDDRMDFSDGFSRWPCGMNITRGCAGGGTAVAAPGLLSRLIARP